MRVLCLAATALAVAGCVTSEKAEFTPSAGQEAIVRDGNPAIVSKKPSSIVLVRPAKREMDPMARPVFVVAAYNAGAAPTLLSVSNITVEQMENGQPTGNLKVYTYEDLVKEEQTRQAVAIILTGMSSAANTISASNAGYYNSRSTIYTPSGASTIYTSGYSPAAASIARNNAAYENAAMTSAVIERGQQSLAALENQVLKDNTIMPGEWIGGQVHFAPPTATEAGKQYRITVVIGGDTHQIDVKQKAQSS